jgi:hypothetical protein
LRARCERDEAPAVDNPVDFLCGFCWQTQNCAQKSSRPAAFFVDRLRQRREHLLGTEKRRGE